MLDADTRAKIPAWVARKDAQWQRVSEFLPGLQLIRARGKTQYTLICSLPGFYESIVFGQLPEVHHVATGSKLNPRRRPATEAEKPFEKKAIDLTDDQIDEVLARWHDGKTALTLPFVDRVWSRRKPRF
jgi:hypothetical protein